MIAGSFLWHAAPAQAVSIELSSTASGSVAGFSTVDFILSQNSLLTVTSQYAFSQQGKGNFLNLRTFVTSVQTGNTTEYDCYVYNGSPVSGCTNPVQSINALAGEYTAGSQLNCAQLGMAFGGLDIQISSPLAIVSQSGTVRVTQTPEPSTLVTAATVLALYRARRLRQADEIVGERGA